MITPENNTNQSPIEITINPSGTDRLQINWRFPNLGVNQNIYYIDKQAIIGSSKRLRKRINELTTQFLGYYQSPQEEKILDCKNGLFQLAREGYNLYTGLFNPLSMDNLINPEVIKEELKKYSEFTIHVFNNSNTNVPWGLIYDVNPLEKVQLQTNYTAHLNCPAFAHLNCSTFNLVHAHEVLAE